MNRPEAIPSYLIIGGPRGGTTDLFDQLTDLTVNNDPLRPDPPIRTNYELTHHWKQKELALLHVPHSFPEQWVPGKEFYLRYLRDLRHPCANVTAELLHDCVSIAGNSQYTFDATPGYLRSPTVPLRLEALSPYSKILAMLRDPLEVTESLFYHWLSQGKGGVQQLTLDGVVDEFFRNVTHPGLAQALDRLADCTSVPCQAGAWRDLAGQVDVWTHPHLILILGSLHSYGLAAWRLTYLQPGRAMVIDAHLYARNRSAVMKEVIFFMYGRAMTASEASRARSAAVVNSGAQRHAAAPPTPLAGLAGMEFQQQQQQQQQRPAWQLSPDRRARLRAFYTRHLYSGFRSTLRALEKEGVWVLGFEGEPWATLLNGPGSSGS